MLRNLVKGFIVSLFKSILAYFYRAAVLKLLPVEIAQRLYIF